MLPSRRSIPQQPGRQPFGLVGYQLADQHRVVENADVSALEGQG